MATLSPGYSLVEQLKQIAPDGSQMKVVEALALEMGMILEEAPWMPSNDVWTHKSLLEANRPAGTWRKMNQGVPTEVRRTTERLDVIGMLETYSECDKAFADKQPSPEVYRMGVAKSFLRGLGKTLVDKIIYGNANADPDQMHGFKPRLDTLDGDFVIDGGGTGSDLTSIYVVTWDPEFVHLIYSKNTPGMGVIHTNLGEVTLTDATTSAPNTSQFQGYRDHFKVECGLVVANDKYIGRVANIETAGATNTFDEDDLITLLGNMTVTAMTRIYMNQTIMTQGRIKLKDKLNINWSADQGLSGQPLLRFDGIPVRKIDKQILLNTESAVT